MKINYMTMRSLLSNDDNDDLLQFKATGKKELEGYLTALGVPFIEGTLKAALISALQEALKE